MSKNNNEKWWKKAVVYQIYPKSFQDSNGDGFGDLQGIIKRLDYLETLGINAIWLSPVFKSPQADNGYDISDYRDIDPTFGSLDDMEELINEAKKHNIRIMMDLVLNHSSNEHRWFKEAKKSKDNPYHDYYIWRDGDEGVPPSEMKACFGGSAWEYVPELGQYYFHQFLPEQPDLKWDLAPLPFKKLKKIMAHWQNELYNCGWNSLFWDNHDLPRIVSRWGNDREYRVESAKMLAILLHGMQGTPYIYQGEELGMTNVQYDIEDYKDCEIINMYHERLEKGYSKDEIMKSIYAKGRDNARTPMQWDDSANAGFTTGTPWIKVNDNYDKINAKSQVDDPDSIFSCYKKLVQLRKDYPVFVDGKFTLLLEDDENIFAYSRKNEEKTMIVVCNFFDKEIPMPLAKECEGMEVLISNYKDTSDMSVLRPYEARMYIR